MSFLQSEMGAWIVESVRSFIRKGTHKCIISTDGALNLALRVYHIEQRMGNTFSIEGAPY